MNYRVYHKDFAMVYISIEILDFIQLRSRVTIQSNGWEFDIMEPCNDTTFRMA
jgi:hypothetical protein